MLATVVCNLYMGVTSYKCLQSTHENTGLVGLEEAI
jgi:hypothetical protein